MKNKILNSLKDLKCLLSEEEQEHLRLEDEHKRFVEQNWPYLLRTERRLLPMLPRWMRNKITVATELYDHCNTSMGDDLIWNHTFTLPLDGQHEVTFAILDNRNVPEHLKKYIGLAVEVYKDLQCLYAKYDHPLTIVSLQTDDFGMYLPESFYDPKIGMGEIEKDYPNSCTLDEVIMQIAAPRYSRMSIVKDIIDNADEEVENEQERVKLNTWYAYQDKKLNECKDKMMPVLASLSHDYYPQLMWECIDIYMYKCRAYGRELCIKWDLDEDVERLKKIDKLRPLIDSIMEKTCYADFAFGVKRKGSTVIPCDHVTAE